MGNRNGERLTKQRYAFQASMNSAIGKRCNEGKEGPMRSPSREDRQYWLLLESISSANLLIHYTPFELSCQ